MKEDQGLKPLALIAALPEESREKLRQAGFKVNKSLDSHRVVSVYLLGEYCMTPLTYAAKNGDLKLIKCLLDNGADINLTDKTFHLTPLMWATWYARSAAVRLLLHMDADPQIEACIPGYAKGNAYQFTKKISLCSLSNLWYTGQYYLGEGDMSKTRRTLSMYTCKCK